MSSLKMTFSLTSLIFLIALGLVFMPTSVMAHSGASGDAATPRPHGHPLAADIPEKTGPAEDDDLGTAVEAHDSHPQVTSIVPKPDAASATLTTSMGRDVILLNADGDEALTIDGTAPGSFSVRITFSGNLAPAEIGGSANVNGVLAETEVPIRAQYANGTPVDTANALSVAAATDITPVTGQANQFDVKITVPAAAYWDSAATPPASLLPITVFVDVSGNALQTPTGIRNSDGVDLTAAQSYAHTSKSALAITVIRELPEAMEDPDTTPPMVTIDGGMVNKTTGKVVFTITTDEDLGPSADALMADDFRITNGSQVPAEAPVLSDPMAEGDGQKYTLTVTPANTRLPVSIVLPAGAVGDGTQPTTVASESDTSDPSTTIVTPDDIRPTATVTRPTAPESNGDLKFTLDFSEEIDESTLQPGTVGVDNVKAIAAPVQDATVSTRYTVLVTPEDPMEPTRVEIADAEDLAGNILVAEAADTYTPPGPPAKETVPPTVTIGAEGYMMGSTVKGLNCEVGNRLTFTYADPTSTPAASGVKTGSVVEASEVTVVTAGWEKKVVGSQIWVVPKTDRSPLGVTAVEVKVAAGAIEDNNGNMSIETPMTFTVGPVLTIPANGYIVVLRTSAYAQGTHLRSARTLVLDDPDVEARNPIVQYWDCMPDLSLVFDVKPTATYLGGGRLGTGGGGLLLLESYEQDMDLTTQAIARGTVGISEIMWAQDQGITFGNISNLQHAREQWIELHNFSNAEVKVTLFDLYGQEAYHTQSYAHEIDRVSNFNIGGRWEAGDRGQDGNSERGIDFISMQRTTPTEAAKDYDHGDHLGRNGGKWSKSGHTYLTRRANLANTGVIAAENLLYDFYGTPGRPNSIKHDGPITPTPIPRSPFIINEVANRSNRIYEWIEIKATADGNLRNYIITTVTAVGTEEVLYTFPNSDINVKKDDLILIVATDPEDDGEHPLAVGKDFFGGNDQVRGIGLDVANSDIEPANYIIASSSDRLYTHGMPDDGNFVLFLRRPEAHDKTNAASKLKTHEWVIDIAGYHSNLGDPNVGPDYSALWPLKVFGAPNLTHNRFDSDQVHRRQHAGIDGTKTVKDGNHVDQTAFRDAPYTGIGYRRHATNSAAHGGTPGYEDIRKNLYADVKEGKVRISEIMFEQGDGRTPLPQWIEIHNTSPTEAVNLRADDGWRLIIENYDDGDMPIGRISGTLNFNKSEVQTLLPLQTVLVASTRARNAGSASINASVVFIPTRVFSVYADARDELAMKRATDPILSETGFHIELVDGKGNFVDAAGNLPVDASGALIKGRGRSVATVAWEWTTVEGVSEDNGFRSSFVRRSITKVDPTRLGVEAAGWISASATNYRRYVDTWYGDEDDVGSPGITVGGVLPVSLSKFRPERLKDTGEVVVRWITESETNNAGFNILRSETRDGQFTKINTSLIAGQGTTSERTTYEWKDSTAKPNVVYYYQIQDVSLDGQVDTLRMSRLKGNVTAAGKVTTTWGELKALQ